VDRDYSLGGMITLPRERRIDSTAATRLAALTFAEDVVVRWGAQQKGTIRMRGAIERPAATGGDGVRVTIWKVTGIEGGSPPDTMHTRLWERVIRGADPACEPASGGAIDACGDSGFVVDVTNGDRIYFQVHALSEIDDDVVSWDPKLTYESYGPCVTLPQDQDNGGCVATPAPGLTFQRSTDYRVSDRDFVGWQAPAFGAVRVLGSLSLGGTTSRTLQVIRRRTSLPFSAGSAPPT
jgi:hypothetical protein